MKIKLPEPFTFHSGKRAVLLLHGFTGHSADVRMLGRYLEKKGYTTHAPIYRGHGVEPEKLIESSPEEWWEDVVIAYKELKEQGYDEIAVAGLSMGGALALKLATEYDLKAVIPMCTPVYFDNKKELAEAYLYFAKQFKMFEKKDKEVIKKEVDLLYNNSSKLFNEIEMFVNEVNGIIKRVDTPTFVVQARLDEIINPESATFIYDHVATHDKEIKWYENSTHLITFGEEKDMLHEDIYNFLETLNWEN